MESSTSYSVNISPGPDSKVLISKDQELHAEMEELLLGQLQLKQHRSASYLRLLDLSEII